MRASPAASSSRGEQNSLTRFTATIVAGAIPALLIKVRLVPAATSIINQSPKVIVVAADVAIEPAQP
jgi:hypothetical protein